MVDYNLHEVLQKFYPFVSYFLFEKNQNPPKTNKKQTNKQHNVLL